MRQIAKLFIKPLYDKLLEQDQQDGRDSDIQQTIDNYEQSHSAHSSPGQDEDGGNSSTSTEANDGNGKDDSVDQSKSLPEQIKEAIEQAAESTKENGDDGDDSSEDSNPGRDSGGTTEENNNKRSTSENSNRGDEATHPADEELAETAGS